MVLFALAMALLNVPPEQAAGHRLQRVNDAFVPSGSRIRPAGKVAIVNARPVDAIVSQDGSRLFVKDNAGLRILRADNLEEVGFASSPGGASLTGMDLSPDGKHLYFTNSGNKLHDYDVTGTTPKLLRSIDLPGPGGKGNSFPCGVRVSSDGQTAYVCLSLNNSLGIVDLASGMLLKQVEVGIAPYGVALNSAGDRAVVTNQGGYRPSADKMTALSAGSKVRIDARGVASMGSISMVDLSQANVLHETELDRQPSAVIALPHGGYAVAAANDDRVVILDAAGQIRLKIDVKPDTRLPFGSMPTSLAVRQNRLYVALAGNNAVAVIDFNAGNKPKLAGFVPTGWYPTAVTTSKDGLFIASAKGLGSRRTKRSAAEGWNSYDYAGTVQRLDSNRLRLRSMTKAVKVNALFPATLRAMERRGSRSTSPVPVPARLGDPSVFEHVVYVIKENRTYDQVFGDMKKGDSDPKLCIYGEEVTPNQHAIAREFALLDNYYCSGVLSADGHSWATEANVTPYLERAFGGFTRSYTFGDDPLTYSSTGFLWDRVLDAGLSFKNFGEMDYAEPPKGKSLRDLLKSRGGAYPAFTHNIGIDRLRRYSDPQFPGWNMEIPDVVRIDRFIADLAQCEKTGVFPNLSIVYLPQDHTGSSVTARANVADNDLAVGLLVEAISKSKFWAKTAIFINEDDPQGGFDHVDGHRSTCLVVSPYTRGRGVVSDFANQTSVIHTMLRILGLPPLNQRDASSPLMVSSFGSKRDLTPFKARPNRVPLDETTVPGQKSEFTAFAAPIKARLKGMRESERSATDDDMLNRMIWHEAKGMNVPYPIAFAGPHGRGLAKRGLKHASKVAVDLD